MVIRGNIQGGGLEKDKKVELRLSSLPLHLCPLPPPPFRPSTFRRNDSHNKKYYKPIKTEKNYFHWIDDYCFHLLPLLRFYLPSRTVILLTEITQLANLCHFYPFPYRFPPVSHQYCLNSLRHFLFFVLFTSFYRFTFLFIIIPSFFILYLSAKTDSTNVYPEVTICASRVAYRHV